MITKELSDLLIEFAPESYISFIGKDEKKTLLALSAIRKVGNFEGQLVFILKGGQNFCPDFRIRHETFWLAFNAKLNIPRLNNSEYFEMPSYDEQYSGIQFVEIFSLQDDCLIIADGGHLRGSIKANDLRANLGDPFIAVSATKFEDPTVGVHIRKFASRC